MKIKNITLEMVEEFNKVLDELNCSFKYRIINADETGITSIERVIKTNVFVSSATINVTDEFYAFMITYFKNHYGIKLSFNNDGSVCWSGKAECVR